MTSDPIFQLAQVNLAKAKAPLDTPLMAGFVERLDDINALAEQQPGFVWRLIGDGNDTTDLVWSDDPLVIVNMSVWETIDALFEFVYKTNHTPVMARRREWFDPMGTPAVALWWIESGHHPTIAEAQDRIQHLHEHGPTPYSFTFTKNLPPFFTS